MKLTKIIEKLYNNQLETTKQVDAIQAHANNLKGLNLARLKLIDKLDKIEAEPSGNKTKPYRLDFLDKEGSRTNWVLYPAMLISDVQTMLHLILKDFQTNNIRSEYALYLIVDCIKKGESLRSGEWHLHPTKSQPSGNIEQLKEVVQELESDHSCTHPHWEETPTKNIIIKTCSTCGVEKFE